MRNLSLFAISCTMSLGLFAQEKQLPIYFWDNQDSLVKGENCHIHIEKESPFRISSYTGRANSLSENLRNSKGVRQGYVPTGSIVKIISSQAKLDDYQSIEMVSDNLGNKIERHKWFADRGDQGFLYERSLLPLEDFVIELGIEAPNISSDSTFVDLVGTKLTLVSESQYYKLNCDNLKDVKRKYFVFKAYRPSDLYKPGALIGISQEETEILKSISTERKENAKSAIPAMNLEANLVHLLGSQTSMLNPAKNEIKEVEAQEIEASLQLEEELENAENDFGADEKFNGSMQNVVCTEAQRLNVRSEDLKRILFKARVGEKVKVFQGFNAASKKAILNGTEFKFVKVQFPEREEADQREGWVAEIFIKAHGQCKYMNQSEETNEAPISSEKEDKINGLDDGNCCEFPTVKKPTHDYTSGARAFGAGRSGGKRKHAACDLYRELKEPILSVAPGKIIRDRYHFYQGTYALEVVHSGGFVVRYGELDIKAVPGMSKGKSIKMGEKIGHMGKVNSNCCRPMLHFELFKGNKTGALSTGGNGFQRRSDLLNPTPYLLRWEREKF